MALPAWGRRRTSVHVPYKGANPGLADFYSGHLPMFAASISPQVLDMHRLGKIRILVAGSPTRLQGAPDIPISSEVGFPDLITVQFMGVFAPAGTPRTVIDQIVAVSHRVMVDKEVQGKLIKAGFEPVNGVGPEETAKFVQDELVRWTPLLKASGIKMN
jgi:tripartite-type tricarboxylate transporter receptor subunit TctC